MAQMGIINCYLLNDSDTRGDVDPFNIFDSFTTKPYAVQLQCSNLKL